MARQKDSLWKIISLLLIPVSIVAAPALAPSSPSQNVLSIGQKDSKNQSAQEIADRFKRDTDSYEKAFDELDKQNVLDKPFRYDLSPLARYLELEMRSNPSDEARQAAAIRLTMMRDYEVQVPPSDYARVAAVVPPTSPLWKTLPESIRYMSEVLPPDAATQFLDALVKENPDRVIQARALIASAKLAVRQHDSESASRTYRRLKAEYSDIKGLSFDISRLNPDNKIAIGKQVPIFHLPSIGGGGITDVTNTKLAGGYYLIDFWATWCGPCLGERAGLNGAFERFKGKNFTIVSISLDENSEAVERYRKTRWSMPWQNAFLPGGQENQTARDYDVDWIGLPRLVLVGPGGKVLAIDDQLGRESIQGTLEQYLGR